MLEEILEEETTEHTGASYGNSPLLTRRGECDGHYTRDLSTTTARSSPLRYPGAREIRNGGFSSAKACDPRLYGSG